MTQQVLTSERTLSCAVRWSLEVSPQLGKEPRWLLTVLVLLKVLGWAEDMKEVLLRSQ